VSRVLLIEDEAHLRVGIRFNLENYGYEVDVAETGEAALSRLEAGGIDLVILDVGLAGELDGFQVAKRIRQDRSYVPIIMLTAREGVDDRIRGLDAGADDYLTKPFDLDELMARVRGHLRRQVWARRETGETSGPASTPASGGPAPEVRVPDEFTFGAGTVNLKSFRALTCEGNEVALSAKEAALIELFYARQGDVLSRATFLEEVWNEPATLETRTVDNFVLRLRKYFEPDPKNPRHILSVRGVGYRFVQ
jgi:DNA-binding response OmpR family regulator